MSKGAHRVRRATVDDLKALTILWGDAQLPVADLEKRVTEFQVIEGGNGKLIGAMGLRVSGLHGLLHSEVLVYPDPESELRAELWARMENLARNHGLARLWTLEGSAYWPEKGFNPAPAELLTRFPTTLGDRGSPWLTLELRREQALASLDKEFELFKITQQEATEKVLRQAKVMKVLATIIAIVFLLGVIIGIAFLVRQGALPSRR